MQPEIHRTNLKITNMKKLMLLVAACCMLFCACNNKTEENQEATTENQTEQVEQKECKGDCCKKMMEQWQNIDNMTAEEQTELINKRYECMTKKLNALNMDEIGCPNAKKAIEDFKTRFAAAKDEAAKKELINEFDGAHWKHAVVGEGGCKHEEKAECDNKCGKDCKTECCKDNCKGGDCKHDCKK